MLEKLVKRPISVNQDKWFFGTHLVPEPMVSRIYELDDASSRCVWNSLVRRNQYLNPKQLPQSHWSRRTTYTGPNWETEWNDWHTGDPSTSKKTVENFLRASVSWHNETTVIFITHRDHSMITTWDVFCSVWHHFLMIDEGPLVLSIDYPEFIVWDVGGFVGVGHRG